MISEKFLKFAFLEALPTSLDSVTNVTLISVCIRVENYLQINRFFSRSLAQEYSSDANIERPESFLLPFHIVFWL